MQYNFCTLFDRSYMTRGLALYHSLERHCAQDFTLTILCIDVETRDILAKLRLPHARLVLVEDLGDPELVAVRETRPRREFCWTCPGSLMLSLLAEVDDRAIVTYLDADLAFYSDPQPIFDELGDKEILIHGHRYAPRYAFSVHTSGIFNVGLIAVRNAPEGRRCMERWRAQCIELCIYAPDEGYCGDQKYLDEWPSLYTSLVILQHPGAALAPWNVENHVISQSGEQPTVDGKPLIFYHYHALVVLIATLFGRCFVLPSVSYSVGRAERRLLYRPYVRMLREAQAEIDYAAPASLQRQAPSIHELYIYLRRGQFVIG
jgi:hypothetical protein